ncbi:uncharacterized protein LOC143535561 [Bidens hawaiensis]|uniref:uncharacterized protein LOC143535561 n=1 Tax=Bidens hawaiensis TaxID=980011 RepID=UPI00404B17D4
MDRISQLPVSIVHHILSFVVSAFDPPKEPVRMSVLSKAWFHVTASFPDLYFIDDEFIPRESYFKYVEYTTSRFCHQNLTARKLFITTTIENPVAFEVVNRCLRLLLNNGVEELVIYNINSSESPTTPKYQLPNVLLSVSALKSLTISGCELPSSFMLDVVKFKSLSFLKLSDVHINDEVIKYFTTSCPLLQVVHINHCNGLDNFCVYGHQNLRDVRIDYKTPVKRIDIEAPNLSELFIANCDERGRAPRMNVASCKKLTTVTYMGCPPPNTNYFTNFLSNFSFIEKLSLITTKCDLKLSSRTLKTLMLNSTYDLENVEFSIPNLDIILYSCMPCYLDIVRVLTHLKASVQCYLHDFVDAFWFQKLRLFLGKKNGFKALNLYIRTNREFTGLEKLRTIELPPYELEHVELQLDNHEKPLDFLSFVDIVLWCCRPRSLTLNSSTDFDEQNDVVLFTYEKLRQQEDQRHNNIKIVSPSSLLVTLPRNSKAISFIKEEVIQEEAGNQRFAGLKIF